jgi:hypothetical protein
MIYNKENNLEKFRLMAYNVIYSDESKLAFQKNILPPSVGSKSKPSMKAE